MAMECWRFTACPNSHQNSSAWFGKRENSLYQEFKVTLISATPSDGRESARDQPTTPSLISHPSQHGNYDTPLITESSSVLMRNPQKGLSWGADATGTPSP